jgi:tetratricopeptide (TPR) repeat protein
MRCFRGLKTKKWTVARRSRLLLIFLVAAIPILAAPQPPCRESGQDLAITMAALDRLMEDRSVESSERAAKGYEALLKSDPDNPRLMARIAHAYVTIISIKTTALIEERDEFKPLLKTLGKAALEYAEKALRIDPQSKEAVGICLVACGYYAAGIGIFKSLCKGVGRQYKDLAWRLIRLDAKFEGALGYRSLGKFYELAPWPVGSRRKALKYFRKAVEVNPRVLHAHYHLGMLYLKKGDLDLARREFSFVAENPAHPCEAHYISAYKDKARKQLQQFARKNK